MGARANIKVVESNGNGEIYLYSHWDGTYLRNKLQNALARKQRWDDDAYLTRIIFSEMIKDDVNGETGYGIATYMPDNEYPVLIVDVAEQTVEIEGEKTYSFQEFVNLDLSDWSLLTL